MSIEDIDRDLGKLRERYETMAQRLGELEMKFEGTRVRIDRIVGTCDDLLKRFEAWKSVGNDMGQDVIRLTNAVEAHGSMWQHQQQVNTVCSNAVEEMKNLLQEIVKRMRGEPVTNGKDDEGRD